MAGPMDPLMYNYTFSQSHNTALVKEPLDTLIGSCREPDAVVDGAPCEPNEGEHLNTQAPQHKLCISALEPFHTNE